MLAFFLVERGKWGALLATSVLAAFVRETYVLVYPYVFLRELRLGGRSESRRPHPRPGGPAVRRPCRHPPPRHAEPADGFVSGSSTACRSAGTTCSTTSRTS